MGDTTKVICTTVSSVFTALILGEVFGNVISRPIAAWRGGPISRSKLATLLESLNTRLCTLEEKKEET